MSTATRLTERAAQLVLLGGLSPELAVDTAASEVSCAPAAVRLARSILARADRPLLRRLAGGAR